MKLSRILSALF